MIYNIISTGSKGNATVIDKVILIDCGVPFKALLQYYRDIQLVLLTHIHGDHFNKATIRKLAFERPTLRFGCCEWLVTDLLKCGVKKEQIDVYAPGYCFIYPKFTIMPERLLHNVSNCGYHVWIANNALFYATDTNSLNGIEAPNYDLYMIEANYSEPEILERIKEKESQGIHCYEYDVLKNHLSLEKCNDWLYRNLGDKSEYIYMHQHEN
ncbi:MBL fold metallo-hydrolase [Anaerotignum sp.]|uniref:MBL fold metallo-hydrolase n=1 Tax=Anaerotignum sp. TaxID=2039241 RepID=UPI002714810F|nr:MBL fold metallo-hydrolase [Anaerotignum sp.]